MQIDTGSGSIIIMQHLHIYEEGRIKLGNFVLLIVYSLVIIKQVKQLIIIVSEILVAVNDSVD